MKVPRKSIFNSLRLSFDPVRIKFFIHKAALKDAPSEGFYDL